MFALWNSASVAAGPPSRLTLVMGATSPANAPVGSRWGRFCCVLAE